VLFNEIYVMCFSVCVNEFGLHSVIYYLHVDVATGYVFLFVSVRVRGKPLFYVVIKCVHIFI
jgi:hypothetical protein